jgi:uncharacterized membrane protein YjjB (DUF3815 family)
MTSYEIIQILSGTVGALCFSILFNVRGNHLYVSSLGGFLSWFMFVIFSRFTNSEVLSYFLVALFITAYCEIMARLVKAPTTTFIMPSLIPLIPGASLYYTMTSAFSGDVSLFTGKAVYTLELSSALALGVIIASAVFKMFFKIRRRHS